MHYMGRGVPQDYVLAHMWFNLSAARGGSAERRDSILHQMTREQIAEAQKLAREWKPGKQPPQ
jgi:TPR repeat protein